MATLRTKGTRSSKRLYIRYEHIVGGVRHQRERKLDGIVNASSYEAKQELARVEREVQAGRDPYPELEAGKKVGELMMKFKQNLNNRSARDDRSRLTNHVIPRWKDYELASVTLPEVMSWIEELATTKLSVQTQRHALNLLSRFFSWCTLRGLATVNPVKMIPQGAKPTPSRISDGPWLEDDTKVTQLMRALGGDLGRMFYLGNRSGLRLGEICGLTMGDMEFLGEGTIRVSHSYDGELKESKKGSKPVKWVPAPKDWAEVIGTHLKVRKLQGAKADDLVFEAPVREKGRKRVQDFKGYLREYMDSQWLGAAKACGVNLTFYQATRHSFCSRNLRDGANLDEVSAAVGHSSPSVTRKHYDHFVRKTFSSTLTRGLG